MGRPQQRSHNTDYAVNTDFNRLFEFIRHVPYIYNQTTDPVEPQTFDLWDNDGTPSIYLDDEWIELAQQAVIESGYVPYTGANDNLDMGAYGITAANLTIDNNAAPSWVYSTALSRIGKSYTTVTADSALAESLTDIAITETSAYGVTAQHNRALASSVADTKTLGWLIGLNNFARNQSATGTVSNLTGAKNQARNVAAGTTTLAIGANDRVGADAGTITSAYANLAQIDSDGGTITNAYHYYVDQDSRAGRITNQYGYYLEDMGTGSPQTTLNSGFYINRQTGAVTNYSVYFAGTSRAADHGLNWNGDTNLYSSAENVLKTDDSFVCAGATIGTLSGLLKGTSGVVSAITDNSANWDTAYTHSQIAGGDSVHVSTTENTNWDAAYAHISADGSSHSYINQSVTTAASPSFAAATLTTAILTGMNSNSLDIGSTADRFMLVGTTPWITMKAGAALTVAMKWTGTTLQFVTGAGNAISFYEVAVDKNPFFYVYGDPNTAGGSLFYGSFQCVRPTFNTVASNLFQIGSNGDGVEFVSNIYVLGGKNVVLSTTTGTKIGTATTQLLGFYNATPVDQPATVADPTQNSLGGDYATDVTTIAGNFTSTNAKIADLIDRLQELGLIA